MNYPFLTAAEAASIIRHGDTVGIGGFSSVGTPKAIPAALAERARELHEQGHPFQVGLITGGATGNQIDKALAEVQAVSFRTPFQSNKSMREAINTNNARYFDVHLSLIGQDVRYGFLGKINVAIIEASAITENGEIILSTSVGISPTLVEMADKILIELNEAHEDHLTGMHDIYLPDMPPHRREIPVYRVNDRIGTISIQADPRKVAGVVRTCERDAIAPFTPQNAETGRVRNNNLLDYKFPTFCDIPDLECAFVQTEEPSGAYGNKSLGEPPIISPAPALRNAVLDATGVAVNAIPMTPKRLFVEFVKAGLIEG